MHIANRKNGNRKRIEGRRAARSALIAAALLGSSSAIAATPLDPWAIFARSDLTTIHDSLLANHPGPVDSQNPAFRDWLERGFATAEAKASEARSFADYQRALRLYVNGFRDGHIDLVFRMEPTRVAWPGFLVRREEDLQKIDVALSVPGSSVPQGAELLSCDGQPPDRLLSQRIDPYYWNADIPHERWRNLPLLFIVPRAEKSSEFSQCVFRTEGTERSIPLNWTITPIAEVMEHVEQLAPHGELGLRKVGSVWFVTIPSFNYFGSAADPMRKLLADMQTHSGELRSGVVVFDVRGNEGGNSSWADMVAAELWGEALTRRALSSFDDTVDWRVSSANLAHLKASAEQARRDGQSDGANYRKQASQLMERAIARGESLVRMPGSPVPAKTTMPSNPVTGRVFLLTDSACFSSCLQFADLVKRMPNVRHIGLPTNADTAYLDNDQVDLPSGLAAFGYSMKVYRHRARQNNQWYDPDIRWPGGAMTDEALVAWIESL